MTPQRRSEIVALGATSMPHAAIAARVGCSRRTVSSVLKAAAIGELPTHNIRDDVQQLMAYSMAALEEGLSDPTDPYRQGALGVSYLRLRSEIGGRPAIVIGPPPPEIFARWASEEDQGD